MIVFDVFVNGERLCRLGELDGVLMAITTWVSEGRYADGRRRPERLEIDVRGSKERAVNQELQVGDEIRIAIEEADDTEALAATVAGKSGTDDS